jgi:hypothetical protein
MAYLDLGTLATAVPTVVTEGKALALGKNPGAPAQGFTVFDGLALVYRATVNAGQTASMSFLRVWVWTRAHGGGGIADSGDWYPLAPAPVGGTDANRGKLNWGLALGEIATDKLHLTQVINGLGAFERIYLQQGTSGGAGYADGAWLVGGR